MTTEPDATATTTPRAALPDGLRLGPVHLTVSDLDRSVAWWGDVAGLTTRSSDGAVAALGAGGDDLVVLHEQPGASAGGRHAGLFHVALLHDSDAELGRALLRIAATGAQLEGASDHGVSSALYLRDPDHHGLEIYADRPRAQWPRQPDGRHIAMYSAPLDLDAVLAPVAGEEPRPRAGAGLTVGHVHLHVGNIERALAFYDDALGLEPTATIPGAAFLAAGGYHHHLGLNTWAGEDVGPAPGDAARLTRWEIVLPEATDVAAAGARLEAAGVEVSAQDGGIVAHDPWRTELLIRA